MVLKMETQLLPEVEVLKFILHNLCYLFILFKNLINRLCFQTSVNNCFVLPFTEEISMISSSNQSFISQCPSAISVPSKSEKNQLAVTQGSNNFYIGPADQSKSNLLDRLNYYSFCKLVKLQRMIIIRVLKKVIIKF